MPPSRLAAAAASTLAHRRFLYQRVQHVLPPVQRAGWVQLFPGALGAAGVDEGGGHRSDSGTREGEISRGEAAHHLRQPQFMARDFKEFIRISGMTHVRTSPFYPQSNGKIERWHKSLKRECIRPRWKMRDA